MSVRMEERKKEAAARGRGWVLLFASPLLFVDLLRVLQVGPITANGVVTLLAAGAVGVMAAQGPRAFRPGPRPHIVFFYGFGLYALGSLVVSTWNSTLDATGLQNVATYIILVFGPQALVALRPSAAEIWPAVRRLAVVASYLYLVDSLLPVGPFSPRSMGIEGLVVLAIVIPGRPIGWAHRLAPYVATAAIAISLSRTTTVIALLMLSAIVLRQRRGGRALRAIGLLVLALAALVVLFIADTAFRDRFLVGDNALDINGVPISTAGRASFWAAIIRAAVDSPWFGHGAGAAEALIARVSPGQSHPHNDYLRFYYDFGLVGLGLFVLGLMGILAVLFRSAERSDLPSDWAAPLAIVGVALTSLTDNAYVYSFVLMPVVALIALSSSWQRPDRAVRPGLARTRPDRPGLRRHAAVHS